MTGGLHSVDMNNLYGLYYSIAGNAFVYNTHNMSHTCNSKCRDILNTYLECYVEPNLHMRYIPQCRFLLIWIPRFGSSILHTIFSTKKSNC